MVSESDSHKGRSRLIDPSDSRETHLVRSLAGS